MFVVGAYKVRSANPSVTNRCPVRCLSFTSVEMVFSLLSNMRLHGMDDNTQANARFTVIVTIHVFKMCKALLGMQPKPYPYNKAPYNYCWRIYIRSATTMFVCIAWPLYATFRFRMFKKDGFL